MIENYIPGIKWFAEKNNIDFNEVKKILLEKGKKTSPNSQPIVNKETANTAKMNYLFLDKIRNSELTKENIEQVAKFLENEENFDPKDFGGESSSWMKYTRVCDYACLALEDMLNGNEYAWNRIKYNLKNKDKNLADWRAWWKKNKDLPLVDIGRGLIENTLNQPITKQNQTYLFGVFYCWAGWSFDVKNRILFNDEKPEDIMNEIKLWWNDQKNKDIASWKKSLAELKDSPKYAQLRKDSEANAKIKRENFTAKRKAEMEKFQKESPEVIEFLKFGDQYEKNIEGIRKALETIKLIKIKVKGTTLEDELEDFEQRLLSDPILIEK